MPSHRPDIANEPGLFRVDAVATNGALGARPFILPGLAAPVAAPALVPSGMTTLQSGDRMLITGEPGAITTPFERFTDEPRSNGTDGVSQNEGAA